MTKCILCGHKVNRVHKHHYPIYRSDGGEDTVSLCPKCHTEFHSERGDYSTWGKRGGKSTAKRTAEKHGGIYPNLKQFKGKSLNA